MPRSPARLLLALIPLGLGTPALADQNHSSDAINAVCAANHFNGAGPVQNVEASLPDLSARLKRVADHVVWGDKLAAGDIAPDLLTNTRQGPAWTSTQQRFYGRAAHVEAIYECGGPAFLVRLTGGRAFVVETLRPDSRVATATVFPAPRLVPFASPNFP